nr:hypothetical protein [Tanacetum cinerariifolium]GEW98511.1 hypothetical protein [Tanacetum cinerariifolium]
MNHERPSTAQNEIPHLIIPNPPENLNPDSVHPMVTRFRVRNNRPTERLNLHVSSVSPLPKSYHGTLSRYKARLVANGSTQLEGVDVDETFSPVVKPGTIRTVLSLVVSRHWPIHQLDVQNAFLHGDLSEKVYMHQPPGFQNSKYPDHPLLQRIIASLHQEFSMTDLGSLNYFLGISVTRDSSGMFLSQKKYVVEILEKAHMQVCLYMHDSREPHFSALKRILRYVRGTLDYGLQLFSSSTTDLRQPALSRFSAEAEYRGVVVAETCWLRNLLLQHQRTKHIEIDIHFVRDLVAVVQVRVLHVPFRYQFVDIFTKGLPSALFEEFRTSLSVRCPPAPTAKEC